MEDKREQEIRDQVREYLLQIALELEAAATGARGAAGAIVTGNHELGMINVQQLYSRLREATYLLGRFKSTIDEAVAAQKIA